MSGFNSTHYLTARTTHTCGECARTIGKGERYSRTAGVWESEFFTNVACLHCAVARFIVGAWSDGYNEDFYGGLGWHLGDAEEVWALRLAVGFNRKWQRFDGAGLMALPRNPWGDHSYTRDSIVRAIGDAA